MTSAKIKAGIYRVKKAKNKFSEEYACMKKNRRKMGNFGCTEDEKMLK